MFRTRSLIGRRSLSRFLIGRKRHLASFNLKILLSLATDKSSEEMVNNLFGIFFATFQMNQIFGNIISTTVIGEGFPSFSEIGNSNASEIESVREKCGLNQVNEPTSCEAGAIDDKTLYLLMGKSEAI